MKCSLVCTHIANCDYPIWRAWLEKYHSWFDEIIICWDLSFRFPIFSSFIQGSLSHLPNIKFLDPIERDLGTEDWRNKSTNEMLKVTTGDWVVSIEQDWLAKDWGRLLSKTEEAMKEAEIVGWLNPTNYPYVHPAYWFIKRSALEETSKDFSPHPEINGMDHFGLITKEIIDKGGRLLSLKDLGFETNIVSSEKTDCFHLGGVNQHFLNGINDPNYQFHRGEIFYVYNWWSMKAPIKQSPKFMEMMKKMDLKLRNIYLKVNPETDGWSKFFDFKI